MSNFDTIFFDLDGTLCDSLEGISKGIKKALLMCGIDDVNDDTVQKMIGIPLTVSLKKHFFPEDKVLLKKALFEYRNYYNEIGLFESHLYPGIKNLLAKLSQKSKLIIITAKPTELAKKVLLYHQIDPYFKSIKGRELSSGSFSKTKMIKESLGNEKAIMIGDKVGDILAGKKNKIQTMGVVYGYGTFKTLKKSTPDYILKSVSDLENVLL